jgi:hypothetical protein
VEKLSWGSRSISQASTLARWAAVVAQPRPPRTHPPPPCVGRVRAWSQADPRRLPSLARAWLPEEAPRRDTFSGGGVPSQTPQARPASRARARAREEPVVRPLGPRIQVPTRRTLRRGWGTLTPLYYACARVRGRRTWGHTRGGRRVAEPFAGSEPWWSHTPTHWTPCLRGAPLIRCACCPPQCGSVSLARATSNSVSTARAASRALHLTRCEDRKSSPSRAARASTPARPAAARSTTSQRGRPHGVARTAGPARSLWQGSTST